MYRINTQEPSGHDHLPQAISTVTVHLPHRRLQQHRGCHAVYDVVEYRVLGVVPGATLSELEIEETMNLVGFLHQLRSLIHRNTEE